LEGRNFNLLTPGFDRAHSQWLVGGNGTSKGKMRSLRWEAPQHIALVQWWGSRKEESWSSLIVVGFRHTLQKNMVHSSVTLYSLVLRNITGLYSLVSALRNVA
jgi:hypothetical protein